MAEIENSKRILLQATYSPIKGQKENTSRLSRAFEKRSFIASLNPTQEELLQLKKGLTLQRTVTQEWTTYEESKKAFINTVEIDVGDAYTVQSAKASADFESWPNHIPEWLVYIWFAEGPFSSGLSAPSLVFFMRTLEGLSGKLAIIYSGACLAKLGIIFELNLSLKAQAFLAWQLKTWSILHDAAQAQYYENRQMLKERLARLTEELGAQDALSLRKIEREEVMKGVLRWLFGPTFRFMPSDIPEKLEAENEAVINETLWGRILYQGELIKFLHNAIEWENMIYFLYPYFWSHKKRWELKKYLDHPDVMHRAFLKSGSARVVLTIRPGFEAAFTALIENGSYLDALNTNHPYLSITEEMENYANTNYPGIRPANPISDARPLIYPKQRKAWEEIQILIKLINTYLKTNNAYPEQLEELQSIVPYSDGVNPAITTVPSKDPWNHDYVYTHPGLNGDYDLVSYGADGVPGGEGENADITNWAEASLIGTWYEYTPTSAMDIKFNEVLPNA